MRARTLIVLTLIPPAVEPDAPPMNIRNIITKRVFTCIAEISRLVNPDDLEAVDMKSELTSLSFSDISPKVPGFANSKAKIASRPTSSKAIVAVNETLASRPRLRLSARPINWKNTTADSAPRNERVPRIIRSAESVECARKLSEPPKRSNPTLLNAEIEWNTAFQSLEC